MCPTNNYASTRWSQKPEIFTSSSSAAVASVSSSTSCVDSSSLRRRWHACHDNARHRGWVKSSCHIRSTAISTAASDIQHTSSTHYCQSLLYTVSEQSINSISQSNEWVSSVLRPHQHSIGYTGDGFYRSKDQTNSIKVMKEMLQNTKKTTKTTKDRYT